MLDTDINREYLPAAPFLFLAGMNIILEYSLQVKVPKFTSNNTKLLLLHAFMDDLSLMSCTISEAQTLLSWRATALTYAGLEFRADKSCSIVIIKGISMNAKPFPFSKATDQPETSSSIPSIHSNLVKFLKLFNIIGRQTFGRIKNY